LSKRINYPKAFSLIELSIVILIIGILVAGVTQSSRLVKQVKLMSARSLTLSSPVPTIKNLIAWYESTSEKSFNESEASDQSLLSAWFDINVQNSNKNNATQTIDTNKPQYSFDDNTGLPIVKFTNLDFFNLPDGTVPFNNSPYTVFFVSQPYVFGGGGILGSGSYGTVNATNAFRYDPSNGIFNYWFNVDLFLPNTSSLRKNNVISFIYDLAKREGYVDGLLKGSVASSNRASTAINNAIGSTYFVEYLNGAIGEIIIFDRALNTEERKSIESYLGKKWSIKIN